MQQNIAIFASGAGSNAARLIDFFIPHETIKVALVVSNKVSAGVLKQAEARKIKTLVLSTDEFQNGSLLKTLDKLNVVHIILAGFLKKIPENFINDFNGKILNIHPSLLPKYGGPGMYGSHVHKAVFEAGETESGITIHEVNKNYDEGRILFQASVSLDNEPDQKAIEEKVRSLEKLYFAIAVEEILTQCPERGL